MKNFKMWLSKFSEKDDVLLLGEGNFSFALALFKKNFNINITASCYEAEIRNAAEGNIQVLKGNGVQVLLGVDATKIKECPDLENRVFDKIIFNFPHVGGKMRIEKNRELLQNFFTSVGDFLKQDGQVIMTLCNGQGGTPADNPRRNWNDSWQVVEMAAHGDFLLTEVEPFQVSFFENYVVTGYRSLEKEFNTKGSIVHFFKRCNNPENIAMPSKIKLERLDSWTDIKRTEDSQNNSEPVSLYPLKFSFDITISVKEDFCYSEFRKVMHNFVGRVVDNIELIDSYEFSNSDKKTKTYRIQYKSNYIPLYRKRVIDIHQTVIAKILEENLSVTVSK